LDKQAFFFQGDNFLMPVCASYAQMNKGFSFDFSSEFIDADIFEIPELDNPLNVINVVSIPQEAPFPSTWTSIPTRQILTMFAVEGGNYPTGIIRACHICAWRRESQFCGTCGSKNDDVPGQAHRVCPKCRRLEFPRICPAIIVIITDEKDRILLAHNKRFRAGLYSHLSGYNEAGESLEETVVREVREEVNIEIKDVEYIVSQPWPFSGSLMTGFKARYASGEIKPDGEEIEDAKWFTRDNLPELPGEGSLSRYLINCWIDKKSF